MRMTNTKKMRTSMLKGQKVRVMWFTEQQQPLSVHGRTSDQLVQTFFLMTQKNAKSCFATHQRSRSTKRLLLLRLFLALLVVLHGETRRIAP
jgi:hypothetical protein